MARTSGSGRMTLRLSVASGIKAKPLSHARRFPNPLVRVGGGVQACFEAARDTVEGGGRKPGSGERLAPRGEVARGEQRYGLGGQRLGEVA
jgi:hypothetical protein